MRIQQQIFYSFLLIFTLVFFIASWVYYAHFTQSLYQSEMQQVSQINRYIQEDLDNLLVRHRALISTLDKDGDVASAYDEVNWVAFMGEKFVKQGLQETYEHYPYLRDMTFYKGSLPFIRVQPDHGTKTPQDALVELKTDLTVHKGRVSYQTDLVSRIQDHLQANRVDPSTRIYYQNREGRWVVSHDGLETPDTRIGGDMPKLVELSQHHYLASGSGGGDGWEIRSLQPQTRIEQARKDLLIKVAVTYAVSAVAIFVIAQFLSARMIRPLSRLEHAALSFMGGNYAPIHHDRQDEMKPAIDAFNLMGERIQNFTTELQDQVSARTRELEIANAELERMNETDVLTKARNRHFLDHQIPHLVKLANRNQVSMGLAMLDIDLFKTINDTHGHVIGDQCLIAFVEKLQHAFRRDNDWVIRYGGEEFVLVCFGIGEAEFSVKLEAFRAEIENMAVEISPDLSIRFTVSAGYSFFETAPDQWSDPLIKEADARLYDAKQGGRNQIVGRPA